VVRTPSWSRTRGPNRLAFGSLEGALPLRGLGLYGVDAVGSLSVLVLSTKSCSENKTRFGRDDGGAWLNDSGMT